jgi:two-component system cell cycle sensor histidine kinase/response regulator CckA
MIFSEQVSSALENSQLYQAVNTELVERKRLEEEQRKWERQQQQLKKVESLNRMAAAIAHNFNNMLTAVIGNIQLAIGDVPEGPTAEFMKQALKASNRAAEVSSLMLTYLGQSIAKSEPLDLAVICRSSLPFLRDGMESNVVLEVDLPSPGPIVNTNIEQIQQVLKNLVLNATESVDGSPEGIIRLAIKTVSLSEIPALHRYPLDWTPQGAEFACIEIRDSGSGIVEKEIDQIFDPFFSTKFAGRGLGLPVALGIVRAHKGLITVETTQGQGSVFKVFFPLSARRSLQKPDAPKKIVKRIRGSTVLLVDDEDLVREMAAALLKHMGYEVLEAKDGVEAVEMFRRHRSRISVVICDLTMPNMDGWGTIEAIHGLGTDVSMILASGYNEAQVMQGDHAVLPHAFLHKPYRMSDLQEALAALSTLRTGDAL